jgi:integrase
LRRTLKKTFRKDGFVFDATNWKREWFKACVAVGEGEMYGDAWYQYRGLTPHDFRRSAIRNMMQAGVSQAEAMSISGHKTVAVFNRYNIVDPARKRAAMDKVEAFVKRR